MERPFLKADGIATVHGEADADRVSMQEIQRALTLGCLVNCEVRRRLNVATEGRDANYVHRCAYFDDAGLGRAESDR